MRPHECDLFGEGIALAAAQLPATISSCRKYRRLYGPASRREDRIVCHACRLRGGSTGVPNAAVTHWSSDAAVAHLRAQGNAMAQSECDSLCRRAGGCRTRSSILLERTARSRQRPSAAVGRPLLIAPRALVPHWREQLEWHVNEDALNGKRIIIDPMAEGQKGQQRRALLESVPTSRCSLYSAGSR